MDYIDKIFLTMILITFGKSGSPSLAQKCRLLFIIEKNVYQLVVTMRIWDVVLKTCRRRWTIGKSGERGSGISMLAARHDDDDDDIEKYSFVAENILSPLMWVKCFAIFWYMGSLWWVYYMTKVAQAVQGTCCGWQYIFTNPSARAGYDTRSIFKRSLTGLNSEFSFS